MSVVQSSVPTSQLTRDSIETKDHTPSPRRNCPPSNPPQHASTSPTNITTHLLTLPIKTIDEINELKHQEDKAEGGVNSNLPTSDSNKRHTGNPR